MNEMKFIKPKKYELQNKTKQSRHATNDASIISSNGGVGLVVVVAVVIIVVVRVVVMI